MCVCVCVCVCVCAGEGIIIYTCPIEPLIAHYTNSLGGNANTDGATLIVCVCVCVFVCVCVLVKV